VKSFDESVGFARNVIREAGVSAQITHE